MSDGRKLLSCIISNGSAETLRTIDEGIFVREEIELFRYIKRHYMQWGRLPSYSTVEEERGVRLPSADEPVEYYLSKLTDRKYYNSVRDLFPELRDSLRDMDTARSREVIDRMRAAGRQANTATEVYTVAESWATVYAGYEHAHRNPGLSGVPTGWPYLDAASGGYQPGDLITWVARMGLGKTYLLLWQAYTSWLSGRSVLFVTTEMPIAQISRRFYAIAAGVDPDFLRKGRLSSHALRRLTDCAENMVGGERLRIYSAGLHKRVSDVEMLMQEYDPDVAYVDGVYLLKPDASKKNVGRFERVAEVFDELATLKLKANRPIVCTTQFSRQAGKKGKDGSLESIGYTDAIGTHSSIILSVGEGLAPHTTNRRHIEIMKGREGEAGAWDTNFGFAPTDFSQVDADAVEVDLDWMDDSAQPAQE